MAAKLYLVDGMSHVYRAFYAIQGLTSKDGRPTNAVFGFTNMLRKLISEEKPHYLAVAVDVAGPTIRHEQYEDYKATRRPMPEDLQVQIPKILEVCEALQVPVLSLQGYEADDVIGTLARKASAGGLEVVIVTIDKDMYQLVNDHVSILDTRNMDRLDAAGVKKKFGVPPQQVGDVLSLVGDSSDNIPGAPGIGAKGAQLLIGQYGNLEELFKHRDEIKRKTYRESLQNFEEQIRQSRELVTIHDDLPLDLELEQMELSEPDREAVTRLFTDLDFVSLLEDFLPPRGPEEANYQEIGGWSTLSQTMKAQGKAPLSLQIAVETGGLEGVGFSYQSSSGFWVSDQLLKEPARLLRELQKVSGWISHDLKTLALYCQDQGLELPASLQDPMLMAYLLNPNHKDFSLSKLAVEYLHYRFDPSPEGQQGLFARQEGKVLAEAADLANQLARTLQPKLRDMGLTQLLEEIEIPLVGVLAQMERTGVKIDSDLLKRMSREKEKEISALEERIFSLAGMEFNLNSPRQLAEVLFEELKLPQPRKTKKAGHYATGVEVLEKLALEHEIARCILDYRELSKLKSTYLDALPRLVDAETGRIHTSYNQMVAATGRLSSSNPNLQNIPIRTESGREIRRAFVAEKGCLLVAADYSQIELRVMAHLSEDKVLVDSFKKGEDIHRRTAREVFGPNAEIDPAEYRRRAKVINFGIMYGLSAFGLAQSLGIERKEAQSFINDYFERYQGVKAWIEFTLEEARKVGHVTTLFGRIRPIPELRSRNWNLRSFGERTAINAPIQGTAADLIKKAMIRLGAALAERSSRARMILQVHDELVLEVPEEEVKQVSDLVRREMEGVAILKVPLKVDLATGPTWYDAK